MNAHARISVHMNVDEKAKYGTQYLPVSTSPAFWEGAGMITVAMYTTVRAPLVARFRHLVRLWLDETANISSIEDMVAHPAYQEIIGMGPAAIPLLFEELERDPNHW